MLLPLLQGKMWPYLTFLFALALMAKGQEGSGIFIHNYTTSTFSKPLPPLTVQDLDGLTGQPQPAILPPLLVSTRNGLLRGMTLRAADNKTVSAFLGVPFARPPIGDLRFRPPRHQECRTDCHGRFFDDLVREGNQPGAYVRLHA